MLEMQHGDTVPVKFNITKTFATDDLILGKNGAFGLSLDYSNGLAKPITLTMRNGVTINIPPVHGAGRFSQDFTIQAKYRFSRGVNFDITHLLDDVEGESITPEIKAMKVALKKGNINPFNRDSDFGVDYHITKRDLDSNGVLYVEELDIVLAYAEPGKFPIHPYSHIGRLVELLDDERFKTAQHGFLLSIELVDNRKLVGDKYVNYHGQVFRVPAIVDPVRVDGFYITKTPSIHETESVGLIQHRLTKEQAEEAFAIYNSVEDAKMFGDPVKHREEEYKRREHEMKQQKLDTEIELTRLKNTSAKEAAAREEIIARLNHDLAIKQKETTLLENKLKKQSEEVKHERELISIKSKDYYEERKHQRGDSSELLKWIPNILIGIGTAILGFKTLTS